MADYSPLLNSIDTNGAVLLVADENCADLPFASFGPQAQVLSNRVDIASRARQAGLATWFSDFDFSPWGDKPPQTIVYRLSKEKAVVHHIANRAAELLPVGGNLLLFGGKQEGIKTFAKTIAGRFGGAATTAKHGNNYLVTIGKTGHATGPTLDDRDYTQLREISRINDRPVFSKPGMFGWDKVDAGSALLAGYLPTFLAGTRQDGSTSLLDLGCGYGYLSLMAAQLGNYSITATDNCAAALLACDRNFNEHRLNGTVVAGDCGDQLDARFDIILCNPPFHQGFQADRALSEKFLASCKRLLAPQGKALLVVNQFVPVEQLAAGLFRHISTPLSAKGFKLVILAH